MLVDEGQRRRGVEATRGDDRAAQHRRGDRLPEAERMEHRSGDHDPLVALACARRVEGFDDWLAAPEYAVDEIAAVFGMVGGPGLEALAPRHTRHAATLSEVLVPFGHCVQGLGEGEQVDRLGDRGLVDRAAMVR
jgi:hypothetical protein